MGKRILCPHCHSANVEHTTVGYVERVATGGIAIVAGLAGSLLDHVLGHKAYEAVMDKVPSEYKCNHCGKIFDASIEE